MTAAIGIETFIVSGRPQASATLSRRHARQQHVRTRDAALVGEREDPLGARVDRLVDAGGRSPAPCRRRRGSRRDDVGHRAAARRPRRAAAPPRGAAALLGGAEDHRAAAEDPRRDRALQRARVGGQRHPRRDVASASCPCSAMATRSRSRKKRCVLGRLAPGEQQVEIPGEAEPAHDVAAEIAAADLDPVGICLCDLADGSPWRPDLHPGADATHRTEEGQVGRRPRARGSASPHVEDFALPVTPKIAFIGAGSAVFTRNLCSDILLAARPAAVARSRSWTSTPRGCGRRERAGARAHRAARPARARGGDARPRARRVRGADYVVTTFQQGGLDAYALDIEIPRRYGVEQCVGDTLGPGGVFRALRTIPVLLDLCREIDAVAPDALLLNYVNPMAANCWAVDRATGRAARRALPHRAGHQRDAGATGRACPTSEVAFHCAGINHQAFFLEFRRGEEDLYPRIRSAARPAGDRRPRAGADRPDGALRLLRHRVERPRQRVRRPTSARAHAMVEEELVPRFTDPAERVVRLRAHRRLPAHTASARSEEEQARRRRPPSARTSTARSSIEAIETGAPVDDQRQRARIAGSIDNLPAGCCVEVPCLVDASGVRRRVVGRMPPQLGRAEPHQRQRAGARSSRPP